MMKTSKFLSAICIFFSAFFLAPHFVFAESSDPLEKLHTEIDKVGEIISAAPTDTLCQSMYGDKLEFFFRSEWIGIKTFMLDDLETRTSRCYRDEIRAIDTQIQKKILTPFKKSSLACNANSYDTMVEDITGIMKQRQSLYSQLRDMPDMQKENCAADSGKYTFTQTKQVYQKFMTDLKSIIKGIKELKGKGKASDLYKKYSWKIDQEKIEKRSSERAAQFYSEFEDSILQPLYDEQSKITSNLGGLPNGKSHILKLKDKISPPRLSKEAQKEEKEKWNEFLQKNGDEASKSSYLQIQKKEEIQLAFARFKKNVAKTNASMEKHQQFDETFTNSMIDGFQPFHITLKVTTEVLDDNTKALDEVINRQNVKVGY